ncbi:MAG: SDR family oxidoreductase [Candidatus Latescibacteria bacterium]|nr:SDR family oxidoreductase [Candidatus Latescibacterota bacterium]
MQLDLSDKVAIVTGASGQLGRVMVRTLAQCGAHVAIHYHSNREMAESLLQELQEQGGNGLVVGADITVESDVNRMKDEVVSNLGSPMIVVNNAVIQYDWTSVLEQPIEDYESQFKSCVMQNVLMARAFVPGMIEAGYGRIIAINTECAMQNFPGQSAYVSGKRGMDGVLRVLAKEIGEHAITVNQVAPGWTLSDRDRSKVASTTESNPYIEAVPLRRRGEDQEIANVVAFLASDLSSFITGAYIPVCGGNVMPAI